MGSFGLPTEEEDTCWHQLSWNHNSSESCSTKHVLYSDLSCEALQENVLLEIVCRVEAWLVLVANGGVVNCQYS